MKKNLIIFLLLFSLIISIFNIYKLNNKEDISFNDGIEEHGYLRLDGLDLVDSNNNKVRLTGVSTHGLEWYPEYTNVSMLNSLRDYGANTIRLAVYTDTKNGYISNPKSSIKYLRLSLENVLYLDMYAIIDWHVLKDENPNKNIDSAIEFFNTISSLYPNNPGIIYEICNEPNGDTTWQDILEYSNKVIPVIRKNSPDSLIIVGTPKYSSELKSVIGNKLNYDNIMYSYHFYSDKGGKYFDRNLSRAKENDIPVFITEWGINKDKDDFELGETFLNYINDNNYSWINWSLSNKDEDYSIIDYKCDKINNLDEECLTKAGKLIVSNF